MTGPNPPFCAVDDELELDVAAVVGVSGVQVGSVGSILG
jgi:hypothetical protein